MPVKYGIAQLALNAHVCRPAILDASFKGDTQQVVVESGQPVGRVTYWGPRCSGATSGQIAAI